MKKNFLWLLLLIPAIVIAAINPFANNIENLETEVHCSSWGEVHQNDNGGTGSYFFDFNEFISDDCILYFTDLDPTSPAKDSYCNGETAEYWSHGGDGIIEVLPKPGYGGPGFVLTCNVDNHFINNDTEWTKWTCIID